MTKFLQIKDRLTDKSIPCVLKEYDDGIFDIICGRNYPKSLTKKIISALKNICEPGEYNVCTDAVGGIVINSQRICGGPGIYRGR